MSGVQVVRRSVCPDIARLVQSGPFGGELLDGAFEDAASSDRPLKLRQTYGFLTMIMKLLLPPRRLAGSSRTSDSPSRATPKSCTR